MVLKGILKITKFRFESLGDGRVIDRKHGDKLPKFFKNPDGTWGGKLFTQNVKKVGEAERGDVDFNLAAFGKGKKARRSRVKGGAAAEQVKDDVGVDENLRAHRYFSRK